MGTKHNKTLIGHKFGCLIVIEIFYKEKSKKPIRNIRWFRLQCECGRIYERNSALLYNTKKHKYPNTCQCKSENERIVFNRKPKFDPIDVCVKNKACDYRRHAKDRNFEYALTLEFIKGLIFKPCHYCGKEGSNSFNYINDIVIKHNGIDRVDPTKGYIEENCVTACCVCNNAKSYESLDEFLLWRQRVTEYKSEYYEFNLLPPMTSLHKSLFVRRRRRGKSRKYSFNITFEQFFNVVTQNCIYCGIPPCRPHKEGKSEFILFNGADRIDNSKGYEPSNIVPCCWQCNLAKHKSPLTEFLEYLGRSEEEMNQLITKFTTHIMSVK